MGYWRMSLESGQLLHRVNFIISEDIWIGFIDFKLEKLLISWYYKKRVSVEKFPSISKNLNDYVRDIRQKRLGW